MRDYTYVRSRKELAKYTTIPDIIALSIHIIHESLMEARNQRDLETTDPPEYVSPITPVFIKSTARVRLAKFMKVFHPSQLFYCDIDSCYFVYTPNIPSYIDPRTAKLPEKVEI